MTLSELLEGFQQYESYDALWSDPSRCAGDCYWASQYFARYCAQQGFKVGLLALNNPKFRPNPTIFSYGHYVAWVHPFQVAVDWTARQYRYQIDYPLVLNKDQLLDEWELVGLDAVEYVNEAGDTSERAAA